MKHVTDSNFDAVVLNADKPVVVDFSAAWCGPCKMQKPVLERYAQDHPDVEVVMVDVDESPRTSARFGVQAMPTLMLFNKGERKATVRGLQSGRNVERFVAGGLA